MCKRQTRARRDEDKQQRQEHILEAALRLFDRRDFASIRMSDIAEEAGLAKGTLYLYFATKEDVFLALETAEISAWMGSIGSRLGELDVALPTDLFVREFVQGLQQRPRLMKLLALLHAVLEQNASPASIASFKHSLRASFEQLGPPLEQRLGLKAGEGLRFLLHLYALLIGIWQVTMPAPAVRAVLEGDVRLQPFLLDFATELERAAGALLRGWQSH